MEQSEGIKGLTSAALKRAKNIVFLYPFSDINKNKKQLRFNRAILSFICYTLKMFSRQQNKALLVKPVRINKNICKGEPEENQAIFVLVGRQLLLLNIVKSLWDPFMSVIKET